MHALIVVYVTVLGLCIGSFLNVVGHRVPRHQSVVGGRSQCPKCQAAVAWFDNVPVISWLFLRGRCRRCHQPISPRYLIGELAAGVLFATIAIVAPGYVTLALGLVLAAALLTAAQLYLSRPR